MTLTDRILATILGTLIVWAITKVVGFYVQRSRIKAALITDLLLHQRGVRMQNRAIDTMFKNDILKNGERIPFPIRYASEEWILYRSLQRDLPLFMDRETLRKIIKFYHLMWELDQSMLGFANVLEDWEAKGRVLTEAELNHLRRRFDRISSMAKFISSIDVKRLRDLPDDYQEAKTMDSVFQRPNGERKTVTVPGSPPLTQTPADTIDR